MRQDNLNSNYLFDLIGQLGLTAQSDEFKTLLVIRVKREFVPRLNENVELFMSTIESQIKLTFFLRKIQRLQLTILTYIELYTGRMLKCRNLC